MSNNDFLSIDKKMNLTVKEASQLSGIGVRKIYEMIKEPDANFVLRIGRKVLIRRVQFMEYVEIHDNL